MIVLDNTDTISHWLEQLEGVESGSKRIDLATFEVASGLSDDLVIVSEEILSDMGPELLEKLNQTIGVLVYTQDINQNTKPPLNFLGWVGPQFSEELMTTQLNNINAMIKNNLFLKSQLYSMNHELTELMEGVESQLFRVKHAYEKVAPKRLEEFQGFKIYSKYAPGENMGGEFFDLFSTGDKVFIMMSNTSSYLASSAILQLFTELKHKPSIGKAEELEFISQVQSQMSELTKTKKKDVTAQVMTCILDTKTMLISGHAFGIFKLISSQMSKNLTSENSIHMNAEQVHFEFKMKRGERFMLCSPGFVMNWQKLTPNFMIEQLVSDKKVKVLDILDEVFFQLKKDSDQGFLNSDASAIILEVEQNVMLQV
ncbi:MAG: hypothetical protein CME62_13050 [Halobacteriovoraceae bacterium]|nr:hypothetical protein [Halobacteriovoraceae bacterium]